MIYIRWCVVESYWRNDTGTTHRSQSLFSLRFCSMHRMFGATLLVKTSVYVSFFLSLCFLSLTHACSIIHLCVGTCMLVYCMLLNITKFQKICWFLFLLYTIAIPYEYLSYIYGCDERIYIYSMYGYDRGSYRRDYRGCQWGIYAYIGICWIWTRITAIIICIYILYAYICYYQVVIDE